MSTQSTLFYLNGLEHWHYESVDPRDTIGVEFDASSIAEVDTSNGVTVWVKRDSQLGKLLYHSDVIAVLNRVAEEQNASEALRWQQMLNQGE